MKNNGLSVQCFKASVSQVSLMSLTLCLTMTVGLCTVWSTGFTGILVFYKKVHGPIFL